MKVLVTGHNGYIGSVMMPFLRAAGHEVTGLDTFLYEACTIGPEPGEFPALNDPLHDRDGRLRARRPRPVRGGRPAGGPAFGRGPAGNHGLCGVGVRLPPG